ncbi:MAG: endonuclease III [Nanoarchaeota archaeon]
MEQKTALKQLITLSKKGSPMRLAAEEWKNPYETLISIILSARTRDETTIKIARVLFKKFPTPKKLANASLNSVQNIIKPVNFYKNKSKNIINCAKVIVTKYHEKVPKRFEELLELPGVGRKTANVFLVEQGEDGIGVDTHVHYISNFLDWSKNKNPHKVEEDLKKLFPRKYWSKVNATLVRFGKTHTSRRQKDKLLKEIKKVK